MKLSGLNNGLKNIFSILLFLSLSFVFINCGQGPESKVGPGEVIAEPVDNGDWAINFGQAPPNTNPAYAEVSYVALGRSIDYMDGGEFTLEAWVYAPLSTNRSVIFARGGDNEGFVFYIGGGRPYFLLKYSDRTADATPVYWVAAPDANKVPANTWTHLAVVFTTEDHSAGPNAHAECITAGGEIAPPASRAAASHIDMYVNGGYVNCGTTGGRAFPELYCSRIDPDGPRTDVNCVKTGNPPQPARYSEFIGRNLTYGSYYTTVVPAAAPPNTQDAGQIIIDELRFWETDRPAADINACNDSELLPGTGPCGIENVDLLSYWKLDEGTGEFVVTDSSIDQNNGSLEFCDNACEVSAARNFVWDCAELAITHPGVLCTDPWVNNPDPGGPPKWQP